MACILRRGAAPWNSITYPWCFYTIPEIVGALSFLIATHPVSPRRRTLVPGREAGLAAAARDAAEAAVHELELLSGRSECGRARRRVCVCVRVCVRAHSCVRVCVRAHSCVVDEGEGGLIAGADSAIQPDVRAGDPLRPVRGHHMAC